MKRTTPRSVSIFSEKLSGRKQPIESNIMLVRRELIPVGEGTSNWLLSFAVTLIQLVFLVVGLCLFVVSGFSLSVDPVLLYGGLTLICIIFTLFYYDNWLTGARGAGAAAMILATTVTVLFIQQPILSGFGQLGCAILEQMNSRYNGDYMIPLVTEVPKDISIFLLVVFVPLTAYLGGFVVKNTDTMLVGLLVFPLIALLLLLSATPSPTAVMCILLGVLSVAASERVGYRRGLWGKKDSQQWKRNRQRRQKISAASALWICLTGIILAIPSFLILGPSLSIPLAQTVPYANAVEGQIAQAILTYIPNIYRGEMSAPLSTFGGGVAAGNLSDTSGYLISGVEDLSLRCTKKPQETVYLRGFIGGSYEQNQWLEPDETAFRSASANWATEGDAGIYISNLPFLRMLYEQSDAGTESTMAELTVECINANDSYTYTPYGSYLNEYYEINGGDGAVNGQHVQDDIFRFYFRSEQLTTLKEEYFLQNESTLDRLERSYSAYVREQYRAVPQGFDRLKEQCDAAKLTDAAVEDIIAYIQSWLTQNYVYSLTLPEVPEDTDAVAFFLYESKTGCSPHFASAAAIMFRMFGIPSRYVVGYAASASLFTQQADGSYHAVLQSDNAHAWVEIYLGGTGWIPVETTPGQLGMIQDIEFLGTQLSPENTEAVEPTREQSTEQVPEEVPSRKLRIPVVPLIIFFVFVGAVLLGWRLYRRIVLDLGLDPKMPPALRTRYIFAAYYRCLLRAGMPPEIESTSEEFCLWVKKLDPQLEEKDFDRMMALALESCFGQKPMLEADIIWMRNVYRASRKRIRKKAPENKHS